MQKILCRQQIGNDTPHLLAVSCQRTLFSTDLGKQSSIGRCLKSLDKYPLLLVIDLCRGSLSLEITIVCKCHSDLCLKK